MESLQSALRMMRPGCYMASIDLKDAYYTVSVNMEYRTFLRFLWKGPLFEYTCLPNGLACALRLFTKIMKPVFGHLRSLGYLSVIYIDDSYLQGQIYEECWNNVQSTSNLISELGFYINEDKSEFRPSKQLVFLGFVLDSVTMRVYLTEAKQEKIVSKIQSVLRNVRKGITIREFAKLIGLLVSSCIAIPFGMVYTKILEQEKSIALKHAKGSYKAKMEVSQAAISDLQW